MPQTPGNAALCLAAVGLAVLTMVCGTGCTGGEKAADGEAVQSSDTTGTSDQPADLAAAQASAQEALAAMVAAYKSAESYSDEGQIRLSGMVDGKEMEQRTISAAVFERPNKLRLQVMRPDASGMSGGLVVSDGERLWAAAASLPAQIARQPAPAELTPEAVFSDMIVTANIAQVLEESVSQVPFCWMPVQAVLLLADDPLKTLLWNTETPRVLKAEKIDDHVCDRVEAKRSDGALVLWIDQKTHVLRRIELPIEGILRMLQPGRVQNLAITIELAEARFGGPTDANLLTFQADEDSSVVDRIRPPGLHLLGKPVPAFQFTDLDGKEVTPQSFEGKVVVLDFWATWCGPCRQSLPMLESVYERYKDNPKVIFLSVSIDTPDQADNAKLKETFRDLKVTIPIARDLKDELLRVFSNSGVPAMALIDADGVVQSFDVGVVPGLDAGLPAVLDLLLAGKNIYEPALDRFGRSEKRFARWLDMRATNDIYAGSLSFAEESIAAEIAPRGEPANLSLDKLWSCDKLRGPGNITVVDSADGSPEIMVVDGSGAIAQVDADGSVAAVHSLELSPSQGIHFLRTTLRADGRRIWAASAGGSQEVRLLDQDFKPLVTYPEDTANNPHAGIGDVQFADLDGDGTPEMCVGYGDVVGVQGVSPAGERLWANRTLSDVLSMAVLEKSTDTDDKNRLLSANRNGSVVTLGEGGERIGEFVVPNQFIRWIVADDLDGDGRQELCAMSSPADPDEFVVVGLDRDGKLLWEHALPVGAYQYPVQMIAAGKLQAEGAGNWVVAAADGSIHILAADGKPVDQFNYGEIITGLAITEIDGRPTLLVATPKTLDAWRLEVKE